MMGNNNPMNVRELCDRIYSGETVSEGEASFLLSATKLIRVEHELSYAMGALAITEVDGAEEVIASYLDWPPFRPMGDYSFIPDQALRLLCKMGLQQKYRHCILEWLNYVPPPGKRSLLGSAAIACMGRHLRTHKDLEFARLITGFLTAEGRDDHLNRRAHAFAVSARMAAVVAVGGDAGRWVDDKAYEAECVTRFLQERAFG